MKRKISPHCLIHIDSEKCLIQNSWRRSSFVPLILFCALGFFLAQDTYLHGFKNWLTKEYILVLCIVIPCGLLSLLFLLGKTTIVLTRDFLTIQDNIKFSAKDVIKTENIKDFFIEENQRVEKKKLGTSALELPRIESEYLPMSYVLHVRLKDSRSKVLLELEHRSEVESVVADLEKFRSLKAASNE